MNAFRRWTTALAFLVFGTTITSSVNAAALSATYNFTGTGYRSIYTGISNDVVIVNDSYWGTVTVNIVGAPDSDDGVNAIGYSWVESSFDIRWAGGSFVTSDLPGETGHIDYAGVSSEHWVQYLQNRFESSRATSGEQAQIYAHMLRQWEASSISSPEWLSGTSFDLTKTLAPQISGVSGAINTIYFGNPAFNAVLQSYVAGSFSGQITLTSLEVAQVPEPPTLLTLLVGLSMVAFVARRRRR